MPGSSSMIITDAVVCLMNTVTIPADSPVLASDKDLRQLPDPGLGRRQLLRIVIIEHHLLHPRRPGHPHLPDGGSNRTQPTGKPTRISQPHLDLFLRPGSHRNAMGLKILSITSQKRLRFSSIGSVLVYGSPFKRPRRNRALFRPGPNLPEELAIEPGTAQVM